MGLVLLVGACAGREPIVVRDGFYSVAPAHPPLGLRGGTPGLPERLTAQGFSQPEIHIAGVIGALVHLATACPDQTILRFALDRLPRLTS